jgi:CRP-like cAMP-binding protein
VKNSYLSKAPVFGELTSEQVEQVAAKMRVEHHAKGETIFSRGDPSQSFYLVKSGWVHLLGEGGLPLATLGAGSLLGEGDLLTGRPYAFSTVAAGEIELWAMSYEDLAELVRRDPRLGLGLSKALGKRIALLNQYIVEERLRPLPALASLSNDELLALAGHLELETYPGQTLIFREGDPVSGMYIIEQGAVQSFSACDRNNAYVELGAGETLGEMALLTGKNYMASARTLEETTLWKLSMPAYEQLAAQYPAIRLALSQNLRERLSADDQASAVCKLRELPLFAGLSDEGLADVAAALLLRHVPANELVYQRGDAGDALYLIESGTVRVLPGERGEADYSSTLSEGEFFGETALLTGKPRSVAVKAETDVNLWVLYRTDFERLVTRYPSISLALSRLLSERLAAADRTFVDRHLRRLSLLSGLTSRQLEDVNSRLRPVKFRAGEVIIQEGAAGDVMYLIEAGRVEVVADAGRPMTLATLADGEFFGEMALLTGRPRMATVRAVSDVDLWELKKADFDALLLKYPPLTIALSKVLGERLSAANNRLLTGLAAAPAPVVRAPAAPVRRDFVGPVQRAPALAQTPVAPPSPGFGLQRSVVGALEGLRHWTVDAATWFGARSAGAKIRLVAVALLLAWLCGIAAPAAVISSLSARNVNMNTAASLAFLQAGAAQAVAIAPTATEVPIVPTATFTPAPPTATAVPIVPMDTPQPAATPIVPTATPTAVLPTATMTPVPPTPTATYTPLPPAKPAVVAMAAEPQPQQPANTTAMAAPKSDKPPIVWDGRLDAVQVRLAGANVGAGQPYWRIIEARWLNEQESQGKHHIYVEVVDEGGKRIVGQPVMIEWSGGQERLVTEDKPTPEAAANFPMYAVLGTYSVRVEGLPSESLAGMGLGTPELRAWKIHTSFYIKFQRATR